MDNKSDRLYYEIYRHLFEVTRQEVVMDKAMSYWSGVDMSIRFLVAVTTSGSAISGWAIWSRPEYTFVWTILSSFAAILAVAYSTIRLDGLLRRANTALVKTIGIRIRLERLMRRYRLGVDINVEVMAKELDLLEDEIADLYASDSPRFPFMRQETINQAHNMAADILQAKGIIPQEGGQKEKTQ